MNTRKLLILWGIIVLVVSLPFGFIHLTAAPDDATITPLQHVVAALANYLGPWGVIGVRLVDFPNAGLRAFNWALAIGLTLLGAILIFLLSKAKNRLFQVALSIMWGLFVIAWFVAGLTQIASGLL